MRMVTVAATQFACSGDREANINTAEEMVRKAASEGARIILLQELFQGPYFCQTEDAGFFSLARSPEDDPAIARMRNLARELAVVLPVSFFERSGKSFFNSLAVIDADGEVLGVYRKTHIPDGPGYEEKFYFSPGDTGLRVWKTRYGVIGTGICWDQWFPEVARSLALMGAEILFYPTAIGSEPAYPGVDSRDHWQRCMQGHAAANLMPLVASNRIGVEHAGNSEIRFYGSSFIADQYGEKVSEATRDEPAVLCRSFDLDELDRIRSAWGVFRDRRPDVYGAIATLDGRVSRKDLP